MRKMKYGSLAGLLVALGWTSVASAEDARPSAEPPVTIEAREGSLGEVTVRMDGVPTYAARLDAAHRRLVIDLRGARPLGEDFAQTQTVGAIAGLLVQTFDGDGGKLTRVTLSLNRDAQYSIRVDGDGLRVSLSSGPLGPLSSLERRAAAAKGSEFSRATLSDVRLHHENLRDRVELDLDQKVRFRLDNEMPGRSVLVLRDVESTPLLARALDATGRGAGLETIEIHREGSDVVLVAKRAGQLTSTVERQGHKLVWFFHQAGALPSSLTGVGKDGLAARRAKTVTIEGLGDGLPEVQSGEGLFEGRTLDVRTEAGESAGAMLPNRLGQQAGGGGARIDLDLKDADIHNVLRLLGEVSRRNIVVSDDVGGRVTIKLRNVAWEQALAVILQSKKLGMVEQGNLIRIAPLEQLQRERELELERRRAAVSLAPIETRLIPVSYAGATELAERVKPLLSARGSLAIDARTNTIIARDISAALDQIEELSRALDTQTPQVLVEARIVEATSRYLRDVGIQWGGNGTVGPTTGNPTGLAFPNSIGVTGGASDANAPTAGLSPFTNRVANPNFAVNLPAAVGTGQGGGLGLTFGSVDNTVNLAVRLSAAEQSGMLRVLSSPRVLTLDNLEARITQGTLIPFSQVSAIGVQTIFQEAKLQLLVKPHVTADGSVQMHVKVNRDEPDFNQTSARGDPTILKREVETELLVMDGHTAVIGGIFTRSSGRNLDQVPFFGDIPILGILFQRRRASDQRNELVVFITPRIVNRADALGR